MDLSETELRASPLPRRAHLHPIFSRAPNVGDDAPLHSVFSFLPRNTGIIPDPFLPPAAPHNWPAAESFYMSTLIHPFCTSFILTGLPASGLLRSNPSITVLSRNLFRLHSGLNPSSSCRIWFKLLHYCCQDPGLAGFCCRLLCYSLDPALSTVWDITWAWNCIP